MDQTESHDIDKSDWIKTLSVVALSMLAIAISAFFLLMIYWYIWFSLVGITILLLVRWHTRNFGFRCPKCNNEFKVSIFTELISPHGISRNSGGKAFGWYYLKCPKCLDRVKAYVIKK